MKLSVLLTLIPPGEGITFLIVLLVSWLWIFLQGLAAHHDGYLTRSQMYRQGISKGYAFIEHGGIRANVFLTSPMLAILISHFDFQWGSGLNYSLIIFSAFATFLLFRKY